MGNQANKKPKQQTVTYMANSIPDDRKYKAIDSESIRLCDVTAYKKQRNIYQFTMNIRDEKQDIREQIPVLNELVHCIGCENYQLQVQSKAIIDIFDKKFESSLFEVKNNKNLMDFSLKIITFTSYTSAKFKKALNELHITRMLGIKNHLTLRILDYFIYGLNPEQQAFVFLFDRCSTSLSNIAQYRHLANNPWSQKQKLKIIYQIFQCYEVLYNRNIIHRDLRPSNIFYVPRIGRFVIGNFSRARQAKKIENNVSADLMSVCGVPDFSCEELQRLMKQGQHIGYYDGRRQDYIGLKSILNVIQTCEIYDRNPTFHSQELVQLSRMLNASAPFRDIMGYLNGLMNKYSINVQAQIGDRQIADTCSFMLAHTHKLLIQNYIFQVYGALGYHKHYSNKAHTMLNYNNQNGKQHQNAPILTKLGSFYEQKGAKGTEYFYNAFILYILRADNQIRYGYPDKANEQLHSAKQTYFKFNNVIQSDLPRIQINRVQSLIQLSNGNIQNAKNIITEDFVRAAKCNLPIQKQCKILLAYGKIYRRVPELQDEALKKLTTGLTICENSAIFQSPSSCRIMKSKFFRQIGSLYADKLKFLIFKNKKSGLNQNQTQIKAQAESYLRSALQIQQRQAVDDLQVADTSEQLGNFYYIQRNFFDAKRYLDAAKIRLAHFKELINPKKQLFVIYTLGSCHFYLGENNQAKIYYMTCLSMLDKLPKTQDNQMLIYNIEGNLGLTLIRLGSPQGKIRLQQSLAKIKEIKGQNSYDYASLYNNMLKLTQNSQF